jgi:beta-glucosidase-like glycosyl hydrolase
VSSDDDRDPPDAPPDVSEDRPLYKDPSATVDARADDLLARMTIEEKAAQLVGDFAFGLLAPGGLEPEAMVRMLGNGIGHYSTVTALAPDDPRPMVDILNQAQRYLVEESRLGIPVICHAEALSGLIIARASSFPTAIALAASFAPPLVEEMATVIRRQMRALGLHQALSPVMDIARDPRWGRVHETYGEDPYLGAAMSVAYVRGLQGADLRDGVMATAKHFPAYGLSEGGRNLAGVAVSDRELYEVFCRPVEAAIREAGLGSVMNSYSDVNGEVPGASRRFLTDLLRGQLGFDGVVVADYGSVDMLFTLQSVALDKTDAAVLALEAGLDVELPQKDCYGGIESALVDGQLDISVVDRSVRRALVAKLRLGIFEDPYGDVDRFEAGNCEADRDLALELARRSAVLLKNDGPLLPLPKDLATIAVIGPSADVVRNLFSGYTPTVMNEIIRRRTEVQSEGGLDLTGGRLVMEEVTEGPVPGVEEELRGLYPDTRTLLEAVRAIVSENTEVLFATGCTVNGLSSNGIAEAVALAQCADVVILAVGDKTGWVADATSGEGRDRSTLDLPGVQEQLIREVVGTGKPTVAVLINGRPAPIGIGPDQPAAVLEAWQPGAVGMEHVAEILFGDVVPSGKLPITVPRNAGQIPIYHYQKQAGSYIGTGIKRYTDGPTSPAYPFGHGLSYTTFSYEGLDIDRDEVSADGSVTVTVHLANRGGRAAEEVVQLYAHQPIRGITRPIHELVGFTRLALEAGARVAVAFEIDVAQLACLGADMALAVHTGAVHLSAGGSSSDLPVTGCFTIVGERLELSHRTSFFSRIATPK